jgi:hypothetical protein
MAENGGKNSFSYYLQKLKSFFLSKDILSFLLFLALSAAFWFFNSLGKEKETEITIPIHYAGLPQFIAISNNPPTEIKLSVKDQGLHLLTYNKNHNKPLTIDLSRFFYQKGEILITSDQLMGKVNRYLLPTTTILDIYPDSLLIQYEKLSMTVLPIELVSQIELAHQHVLSNTIKLKPSHVTVFGPKRILDTLKTIRTELLNLKNITDTNSYICKLSPVKSVTYSAKDTKVTVCVEQFTEKNIQIPITAINCPGNLTIRTFPTQVVVSYTVGLSHFNQIYPKDIQVYLDYNDLKSVKVSKQKLKIKNNSINISNIRISPQEVEFILEQK